MPRIPIKVPRIPTIEPRIQANPRWLNMRTGGISRMPRELAKDRDIIRDPQEELYGPEPVRRWFDGSCCDECNREKVIPARLRLATGR